MHLVVTGRRCWLQPFLAQAIWPECVAHSLASAPGAALDVNMASAPEPDLREYRAELHEVIIMDEITPEKVLAQKKLFQAGPTEVGLAASATSCHAYKVWVWRKRFVCCSNIWRQRLADLCAEDQEWIHANSVLVVVSEPLWVVPDQVFDRGGHSPCALRRGLEPAGA